MRWFYINNKDINFIINKCMEIAKRDLKSLDVYVVKTVNEETQTYTIQLLGLNKTYIEVPQMSLGLGNGKGNIKLYNENDIVLVGFIGQSEQPVILGGLYNDYMINKDNKVDIRKNEWFINNKINGSYFYIDENDNIIIKNPVGSEVKLNTDGSIEITSATEIKLNGDTGVARLGDSVSVSVPTIGTCTGTITSASSTVKSG